MFPRSAVPWLTLLHRHCPPDAPPSFDDVVVGYDFGLLSVPEIQSWAAAQAQPGAACLVLAGLQGEALEFFQCALWDAAAEATGKAPRPGNKRWARAQDRWRLALLQDAMAAPLSAEALAVLVEAIYESVGCPEDMLDLWCRPTDRGAGGGKSDRIKVAVFIERIGRDLVS